MRTPIIIFVAGTVLSGITAAVWALIEWIANGLFPPGRGAI